MATIPAFQVSVRIWHPTASPEDIASDLGLALESSRRVGEPRASPAGKVLSGVNEETLCVFRVDDGASDGLVTLLSKVGDGLLLHEEVVTRLLREGGRIEVLVGCFPSPSAGDVIPAALLSTLGRLGIDIALDIYSEQQGTAE